MELNNYIYLYCWYSGVALYRHLYKAYESPLKEQYKSHIKQNHSVNKTVHVMTDDANYIQQVFNTNQTTNTDIVIIAGITINNLL